MKISFKNKGRVIVYSKGTTNEMAISFLEKRISKREEEMKKRKWIVDQYNSLLSLNSLDREWIHTLKTRIVVLEDDDA